MTTMTVEPISSLTWRHWALCGPHNAHLFTPEPRRGKALPEGVGEAIKLCRRPCPVIGWCRQWAADNPSELPGHVVAGIYHE